MDQFQKNFNVVPNSSSQWNLRSNSHPPSPAKSQIPVTGHGNGNKSDNGSGNVHQQLSTDSNSQQNRFIMQPFQTQNQQNFQYYYQYPANENSQHTIQAVNSFPNKHANIPKQRNNNKNLLPAPIDKPVPNIPFTSSTESGSEQPYRQFVTTLLDSSTNKLVQITSQPPPDYIVSKKRRNRVTISCMSCKRRKVKCDRQRPKCGSCQRLGYSVCVYATDDSESSNKIQKQDDSANEFDEVNVGSSNDGNGGNLTKLSKNSKSTFNFNIDQNILTEALLSTTSSNKNPPDSSGQASKEFKDLLTALDDLKGSAIQNDEIDQLREKIESLKFFIEDDTIVNSRILKGFKYIPKTELLPVLRTVTVNLESTTLQFGASSIIGYTEIDHYLGKLFGRALLKVQKDLQHWKLLYSTEIYREALEKLIMSKEYSSSNENINLTDLKFTKFNYICQLLEAYFINFETFTKYMDIGLSTLRTALPIVPRNLIDKLLKLHFTSSDSGKLKIIKIETEDDFAEILLILTILRYGIPCAVVPSRTPNELNYKTFLETENINTDHKTGLLMFFLKIIINEMDLTHKYNIPMLATLIIIYATDYVFRFNYKTEDKNTGLNFGIIAIYMAINLGFYSKTKPKNINPKYAQYYTDDDWCTTWAMVFFIDTFSSLNSGMPFMLNPRMGRLHASSLLLPSTQKIGGFYRKALILSTNNHDSSNFNATIIEYERFIVEYETFIVTELPSVSESIAGPNLVTTATAIRSKSLLLFLFYNAYFSCIKTFEEYKGNSKSKLNPNYDKIIEEYKNLEHRLFERCLKYSICSLIDLNILLVSSDAGNLLFTTYSFDLMSNFMRTVFTLTMCICRMICEKGANKNTFFSNINYEKNNDNYNYLFDIEQTKSEQLIKYITEKQYSDPEAKYSEEVVALSKEIDKLSKNPQALIKLLIGFYFNTSQSSISQNFMYFTLYKYFVIVVKQLEETETDIEHFDLDNFDEAFSYVDCTWFIKK